MAAAAIVLALVAGIGVYAYASSADKRAQENASFVDALVANSDIAKGTTGAEVIQAGLVHKEKVAQGSIPPSIITNINDLVGKVASSRIDTKQFITAQTFVSEDDGAGSNFANSIKREDLVAVTVTVDADHGVANQIAPGDHVNIAYPVPNPDGSAGTVYQYLLQGVKVLAVGASTVTQQATATQSSESESSSPAPTNSGVLTFEVTKDQALQVIDANSGNSRIYLVLLPPDASSTSDAASTGAKAAAGGK